MRRVKIFPLLGALLMLCGCQSGGEYEEISATEAVTHAETSETVLTGKKEKKLPCNYFNGEDFDRFERNCPDYAPSGEIFCGTVPHHLLAGELISGFFRAAAASRQNTDTVIIIATMHSPRGTPLCTSELDWDTPFGAAEADSELISLFKENLGAKSDSEMLSADHSAAAVIPFGKHYFPQAKFACLLVSRDCDPDVPERLSELIGEYSREKSCLTVFSTDFSHYLDPDSARTRDGETYNAVMESDCGKISLMTNANVDSARCLETFVRLTDSMGGEKQLLARSDSLEFSSRPYGEQEKQEGITSYCVFCGSKK